METESTNPKLTQREIAKALGSSDSTLKLYSFDLKLQRPYGSNDPKSSDDLK